MEMHLVSEVSLTVFRNQKKAEQAHRNTYREDRKEIDEATGFDHYYSPDEAVDFHLADKVICFSEMEELI